MASQILLVEDDPVSREVVATLLSSRGYLVETAEDGFNALRMAQEKPYDLVFIDYHLPEMDGYALARLMRSLGETPDRPLKMVAITADQFGLAARRGVDTIFDRVLSKPIEPETLFAIADEILGTRALEALETFLDLETSPAEPASPALALWRERGLDRMPVACVFPEPTPAERANLAACFRIVDVPAAADCLLLTAPAGLVAIEALRRDSRDFLKPLVALDPRLGETADALFEPGDGASWDSTADALTRFASRQRQLRIEAVAGAPKEIRLAAYLFVAERTLELSRSEAGEALAPYTAGFDIATIVASVRLLTAQGMIVPELKPATDSAPRCLVLSLSPAANAKFSHEAQAAHGVRGRS